MERWHYTYAGLRVVSDLPIPEWAGFEQPPSSGNADVCIALDGASEQEPGMTPFITADEYCFYAPEAGSYRVREGREIVVTPAPGAGWREVRLFLLGAAWGALCHQRGVLVLHASAVRVENAAVAFCAHAGMGKSTLAAWLTVHSYALVSDDLCRVDIPAQGQPTMYLSAPRLKLWRDALGALGWSSEPLDRDHFRFDKFHLPWTEDRAAQPLPLRAIYVLAWDEWSISRLTGQTALRRFVAAATYRGVLLEPMGQLSAHWGRCLELVRRVPVWELQRPRDLSAMDQTVALLTSHWGKI